MKNSSLLVAAALAVSALSLAAQDQGALPPPHGPGPAAMRGPQLIPPPVAAQLNLSDEQKKQLADLQAEVKAKVESVLTADQLQQLKELRPPRHDGPPGGPAGAGDQGSTQGPPHRMAGPRLGPVIAALDLNHDGVIDADELAKASESLKALDKNNDGQLTPDELRPAQFAGMGGPGGPQGLLRHRGPGGPANESLPQTPAPEQ